MKAYSKDLRQRAVAAVKSGQSQTKTALTFQIGLTTLKNWLKLEATTQSLDPKPIPGAKPRITPEQYQRLAQQMRLYPDLTLAEHCQKWLEQNNQALSRTTLSRTLKRMGWSHKKKGQSRRTKRSSPSSL